ncbi:UUP1 family membrane protein [Roseibacillus persicicus]|uniref:Gonadoliberin III n=1 Tax=Roseibacillus persicicus TaxID=454148 RepID=A0A918WIK2_9BACT|nr:UUP1 family membrane protein [Roseibacillus persicicus]MDQ8190005.1 UUP1 family membrane protein [Roseibacillus persicicus]GHC50834.1 gonadoliberin III [Roseibacillus persicicus]
MKRKSALLWGLVILLCGTAVGLAVYKSTSLGVPFLPGQRQNAWTVEATVRFDANGREVEVELGLPPLKENSEVRQEVASLGYGYQERNLVGQGRRGIWSARSRSGVQRLYYQISLAEEDLRSLGEIKSSAPEVEPSRIGGSESEMLARETLRKECREKSANPETFVTQLWSRLFGESLSQEAGFLRRSYEARIGEGWEMSLLQDFLQMEGIAYRKAWGVILNETLGSQKPVPMIEFYDGRDWEAVEAVAAREAGELVVWSRGDSLLDVRGGNNSQVFFTTIRNMAPLEATDALRNAPAWIGSIAALPVNERRVFRYIALIPVGAFMIVVLRNLVGFNMLGTFMPVLLALSFLEIPLAPALLMFSALLAAGLFFRFFLSRLNLLVVPRVAACVVVVSLLMIVFGLFSWRMGLTVGLEVTVFPMVVLAWTIERMSILWDEEGAGAAMVQAGGSLAAAVLAYLVMRIRTVDYWAQYFPELLLILLAGILLIGRYTGYRMSELIRFKSFVKS